MPNQVTVIIGAGGIGIAIARRQGFGRHILLADFNETLLAAAAAEDLRIASFEVSTLKVDISSRVSVKALADHAATLGSVTCVVNAAGLSQHGAALSRPRRRSLRQRPRL